MRKSRLIAGAVIVGLVLTAAVGTVTYHQTSQLQISKIADDVERLEEKILAELGRFSEIPELLSTDPRLLRVLRVPSNAMLARDTNLLLKDWAERLDADTLYLLDKDGTTLASSNYDKPYSFVGENYNYRPYYQQAIAGQIGRYYALGSRSDKRGYYFSAPVYDKGEITGVITLKVDLSIIEQVWKYQSYDYAITDQLGVVFYSSRGNWLFQSLVQLTPAQKDAIHSSRRYGDTPLNYLSAETSLENLLGNHQLSLGLNTYRREPMLASSRAAEGAGWVLVGFTPTSTIYGTVVGVSALFATFYALVALVGLSITQTIVAKRRLADLNNQLENQVAERTRSLQNANQRLRITLEQYDQTQQVLKSTEDELIQAAKLAMLGELSASINHEINQPLAAMRTYAENGIKAMSRQKYDLVEENLKEIVRLNTMVTEIIARFKVFARKSHQASSASAQLHDVVVSAINLTKANMLKHGIIIKVEPIPQQCHVYADAVQLEQVIINLLTNAIHVLSDTPSPQLGIYTSIHKDSVSIHVWDNGPGIDNDMKKQIFNPFFTTRPDGLGLGLTISRRILDAFSGSLRVADHLNGGAEFIVTIPGHYEESV